MKQLLQNLRARGPHLAELPVPTPQSGMVLVRTAASLVSAGTERTLVEFAGKSLLGKARARPDLLRQVLDKAQRDGLVNAAQAAFGRLNEAMPLGYSSAGTIVELGPGVAGLQVGDRVACAGGGYAVHAEYAVVPQNLVAKLEGTSFELGALSTLGAIALHGFRLADVKVGERVAVIGLGLLGQLAIRIAETAGCIAFGVDVNKSRVDLARADNLRAVYRESAETSLLGLSGGQGFDSVLICADTVSNDPVELAGEIARDRAKVVVIGAVGMEIPRRQYYAKELSLVVSRSYGPGRYDPAYEEKGLDYPIGYVRWTEGRNLQAFIDMVKGINVHNHSMFGTYKLISHRFSIDRATDAYKLIRSKEPFMGVLIEYPNNHFKVTRKRYYQSKWPHRPLPKDKVRLGVLGAGNYARQTFLSVVKGLPGLDLVGISSASGRPAADLARRFRFRYATSDEQHILKDKDIDAVAILTRHDLHARQTIATLKSNKHVFCEKPLALNEDELSAVEKELDKRHLSRLMVGFNRRFAPLSKEIMNFLDGRKEPLVANYRVNAGVLPLNHWLHDPAIGGGRLLGEGCHFIDYLIFLVGSVPVAVTAFALPDGGEFRQDNVQVTLRFADGSLGTLAYLANGDRAISKERVEVFSGGKVAVLDDFRALDLITGGRTRGLRASQDKGHRAAWQAFTKSLQAGGAPPIPYDQIFGGARAIFAAVRSIETGAEVKL